MERRTFFGAIIGLLFGGVAAVKTSQDGPVQAVKPSFVLGNLGYCINDPEMVKAIHMNHEMTVNEIRQCYEAHLDYANSKDISVVAFIVLMPNETLNWGAPIFQLVKSEFHSAFMFHSNTNWKSCKRVLKIFSDGNFKIDVIPMYF